MKKNFFRLATVCIALSLLAIGCTSTGDNKEGKTDDVTQTATGKPDMAKIKTDIQALETSWAAADNARDTNAIAAFYADDAVTMPGNKPMLMGKDAILMDIRESLTSREKGTTINYEVMEVFGDANQVTETGKTTRKDASGKVIYTGKYMAIWEMRNGKYICIRDIGNDDVKAK